MVWGGTDWKERIPTGRGSLRALKWHQSCHTAERQAPVQPWPSQTQDLTLSFENASTPPLCMFCNLFGPEGGKKKKSTSVANVLSKWNLNKGSGVPWFTRSLTGWFFYSPVSSSEASLASVPPGHPVAKLGFSFWPLWCRLLKAGWLHL